MKGNIKCLVLFSGGLDSVIAVHLMKQQGVDVLALHFVLPFHAGESHERVQGYADALNVPLRIEEEGADFLQMVQENHYGMGSSVNPCIDCRIFRLQKARRIMQEENADFLVTGEVAGQRPMSQRIQLLPVIEEKAGLSGYLLRPLSAQLLEPTVPEENGWVDRSQLLDITGKGRKRQYAIQQAYNLAADTPGGGCLLTEKETAKRYHELKKIGPVDLTRFRLLAAGRHFWISARTYLIIGRTEEDNTRLLRYVKDADCRRLIMTDVPGPLGVVLGDPSLKDLQYCCA
ncbi:MAG: 7-cyano-7-deazaguanine synthase, partial [Fibrobacterota bacterium]